MKTSLKADRPLRVAVVTLWLILPIAGQEALAGSYACTSGARFYLDNGRERCSDGTIPVYLPDAAVAPAPDRPSPALPPQPRPQPATTSCQWTGTWDAGSSWGQVALTQQGNAVRGSYSGSGGGQIAGTTNGGSLSGVWAAKGRDRPDGDVRLDLSPDCRSYSGRWKYRESGSWAASQFNGIRSSARPAQPNPQPAQPSSPAGVAGLYWCIAPTGCAGTIRLLSDGSYQINGNAGGRYSASSSRVRFDGQLSGWNNGNAQMDGDTMSFEWKTANGAMQYFAYRKGGD